MASIKELIEKTGFVVAPFVYDAFQAKIAVKAGFKALYQTGFGTAASLGMPDLGLMTMTEMVTALRSITRSVDVPVICDADTGFGNPINVIRTVREYESAGAQALHMEDQVWPKRCGFMEGKQVVPGDEMVQKVKAAVDARSSEELMIIARTDALQPEGWDKAESRARAYFDAGADMVFVDGIHTVDDLHQYAKRLCDLPCLYNGMLLPIHEIAGLGFKINIHMGPLGVVYKALSHSLEELNQTGRMKASMGMETFLEIIELLGVPELQELGKKYEHKQI